MPLGSWHSGEPFLVPGGISVILPRPDCIVGAAELKAASTCLFASVCTWLFEVRDGWGCQGLGRRKGPRPLLDLMNEWFRLVFQGVGLNSHSVWHLLNHQLSLSLGLPIHHEGPVRVKARVRAMISKAHDPSYSVTSSPLVHSAHRLQPLFPNKPAKQRPCLGAFQGLFPLSGVLCAQIAAQFILLP